MTVMGDAPMDGFSDAGSIPARSTVTLTWTVGQIIAVQVRL